MENTVSRFSSDKKTIKLLTINCICILLEMRRKFIVLFSRIEFEL